MAETVDELTIEYTDDGLVTVKELDKKVLTKGAWATLIYRYQDWDRKKEEYGPEQRSSNKNHRCTSRVDRGGEVASRQFFQPHHR